MAAGSAGTSNGTGKVQFGTFEADLRAGELRRNGSKVKLQEQPFQVLTVLLERPGEVVSREELRTKLWPSDTFVDFDHSLNAAVRRLRDALGDSAENPRFVETVARRGYRFVAPVNETAPQVTQKTIRKRRWPIAVVIAVVLLVGVVIGFHAAKRIFSAPRAQARRLTANPAEAPVLNGVISPDGKYLAFSDNTGFYLRQIDNGETHPVPLPQGFRPDPISWFPDSSHLAATWVAGPKELPSIWVISTMGGAPRKLADAGWNLSVSPDGTLITFTTQTPTGRELRIMQSDGQNQRTLTHASETDFGPVAWSPDSRVIAYVRATYHPGTLGFDARVEMRNVQAAEIGVLFSDSRLGPGLAWCKDGRLIYSLQERAPNQNDYNIWSVGIDEHSRRVTGTPVRITSEPGGIGAITVSNDGKRLAFVRQTLQRDVYIADFQANGARLSTPRLLTLDERQDFPYDWTPDAKSVLFTSDRDGPYHIFRQRIDQGVPDLVVGGDEDLTIARLSPDRSWIIYLIMPKLGETSTTVRMMRVPVNGSPPQTILEGPGINNQQCARLPSTLCLFSEIGASGVKMFSFDPTNGSSREISLPPLPGTSGFPYDWTLSPDGKMLARTAKLTTEKDPTIRLFSFDNGGEQKIALPAWAGVTSLDWAADGKSLWAAAYTNTNTWALLNIDLKGNIRPMLEDKNMVMGWAIPSPDGRRLAIWKANGTSNVWMVENF